MQHILSSLIPDTETDTTETRWPFNGDSSVHTKTRAVAIGIVGRRWFLEHKIHSASYCVFNE